jgi:hypothetical protein
LSIGRDKYSTQGKLDSSGVGVLLETAWFGDIGVKRNTPTPEIVEKKVGPMATLY